MWWEGVRIKENEETMETKRMLSSSPALKARHIYYFSDFMRGGQLMYGYISVMYVR